MLEKQESSKLLNYINTPMSNESIVVLYNANNIKYEKCELFNDFLQSLMILIFDTYMGDDITNNIERQNHFKWCWKKTLENFKKEGIIIGDQKLYKYFLDFMLDVYYPISQKEDNPVQLTNITRLWAYMFNFGNNKTKSDMDTLIELYKLFENSLEVE